MGLFDMFKKAPETSRRVVAPTDGVLLAQKDIPDPVFADGMMGKAFAVKPKAGRVFAPYAGTVVAAMPHAIGLSAKDGVELIIHIGIDTVEMAGEGFVLAVAKGDTVQAGDLLCTFDRDLVAQKGYADVVIVAIPTTEIHEGEGYSLDIVADGEVSAGDAIIELRK